VNKEIFRMPRALECEKNYDLAYATKPKTASSNCLKTWNLWFVINVYVLYTLFYETFRRILKIFW
jgi:hypothetical protein